MIRKNQNPQPQKSGIEISMPTLYGLVAALLMSTFASGYFMGKANGAKAGETLGVNQVNENVQPPPAEEPSMNLELLPAVTGDDHIRGNKNAEVVLVEYSDFECPYCQRFQATMKQIVEDYKGSVAWVLRSYPLPFHPKAQKTAEAGECVAELGGNNAYWKMADSIFEKMPDLELADLAGLAQQAGVNKAKFQSCLDSGKYADRVKKEAAEGQQIGIRGTPGTVIVAKNGQKDFVGGAFPIDQVKQQIDKLLK